MGINKHRKEELMTAKKKLILICLVMLSFGLKCQQLPHGIFESDNWYPTLAILNDSAFVLLDGPTHHIFKYYQGQYEISADTLTLHYKPLNDPGGCIVVAQESIDMVNSQHRAKLNFNFYYKQLGKVERIKNDLNYYERNYDSAIALNQPVLTLYNEADSVITSIFPQIDRLSLYLTESISKIAITRGIVRHYPIDLDISEYFGKRTNLDCYIYQKLYEFQKESRVEKYLIKTIAEDELKLLSLGTENESITYISDKARRAEYDSYFKKRD